MEDIMTKAGSDHVNVQLRESANAENVKGQEMSGEKFWTLNLLTFVTFFYHNSRDRERDSRYREREASSRRETSRRSKSREKAKRSKSKEKPRRSRSKDKKPDDKEKDRSSRTDKSKRTKKEEA